jgi:N-methylhydantoinase B
VSYVTINGGFAARPTKDGVNGLSSGISNTMNAPIEIREMSFPVRVERCEIVTDSGGPGRHRGGCGVERVGNGKGALTAAGAEIALRAPGSRGYGAPGDRDPAKLRDDVINGYVSPEAAMSAAPTRTRH